MLKMVDPVRLEENAKKKLEEFLHSVNNRDFVWLDEILEEATKMFNSISDGEFELMPKTPSQKNRRKKKCFSSVNNDQFATKRLSKRNSTLSSSKKSSRSLQHENLNIMKADVENASPCRYVTRSRAASLVRASDVPLKKLSIDLAKDRIPLVEISANERRSAELEMKKAPPQTEKVALTLVSCHAESPIKSLQPLSKASCLVVKETPEAKLKERRGACKLKIANVPGATTTENKELSTQEKLHAQHQEAGQPSETGAIQNFNQSPLTPTAAKANRHSVRRSLVGRASLHSKASLVERYSLSIKREKMIQTSISKTLSKRKTSRQLSLAGRRVSCHIAVAEQTTEPGLKLTPTSHEASMTAVTKPMEQEDDKGDSSEKNDEVQNQPQSARRKPSYKRAVNERDEGQHSEDEFSPPRKRAPSPQFPASKAVRPFKTFLHTVHKNQMLMMTPGSVSRSGTIKSFLKQNTPLRTTPKEKERQRLENLKKKEEAEQQRKQKLEEEKKRRLEEMRRRREMRLHKVLQARERVEQMEEEKKRRFEQKLAQHEKNEKVREEKLAEDKVKKKVAVKKLEELEARRKQEEDARKRRALQLEEEERRHKEQMQKKEEEEQEKTRKIAEQRQLELEREKKLCAERELEKKREQEKLQAQREHERQEKMKAAQLQREVLAAAKEKEQLGKLLEEKERKLQEQRKQDEQQQKAVAEAKAASKQLNVTVDVENSPACKSYQMTPQGPKQSKIDLNNYGMDLNSDDSTDDESQPRKPIPAWATGNQLSQAIIRQYYNPPDTNALFGVVKSPKLEEIFHNSKPRYFKRTSSAVWNSPPFPHGKTVPYTFKR
ncbi:inner centromere protein isoform X2 [Rhineura floridana]|uniref:inner centromere protein isoform X2 n=1 Tax=Rhineura floridana TaxID=261503 RepID=UPI002AC7ECE2|nr:inner centromere protein isoform X2 [Rhineura floridana]